MAGAADSAAAAAAATATQQPSSEALPTHPTHPARRPSRGGGGGGGGGDGVAASNPPPPHSARGSTPGATPPSTAAVKAASAAAPAAPAPAPTTVAPPSGAATVGPQQGPPDASTATEHQLVVWLRDAHWHLSPILASENRMALLFCMWAVLLVLDLVVGLPTRIEWIGFCTMSLSTHVRAFQSSVRRGLVLVTSMLTFDGALYFLFNRSVFVPVLPIVANMFVYGSIFSFTRSHDVLSWAFWSLIIALELFVKKAPSLDLFALPCVHCISHGFFEVTRDMFVAFVAYRNENLLSIYDACRDEPVGRAPSALVKSEYSSAEAPRAAKVSRFELCLQKLSHDFVEISWVIRRPLTDTLQSSNRDSANRFPYTSDQIRALTASIPGDTGNRAKPDHPVAVSQTEQQIIASRKAYLGSLQSELVAQKEALRNKQVELRRLRKNLSKSLSNLRAEVESASRVNDRDASNEVRSRRRLQSLLDLVQSATKAEADLERSLKDIDGRRTELEAQLTRREAELGKMNSRLKIENLKAEASRTLEKSLVSTRAKIESFRRELEDLDKEEEEARNRTVPALKSTIGQLQDQKHALETKHRDRALEKASAKKELDELLAACAVAQSSNDSVRRSIEEELRLQDAALAELQRMTDDIAAAAAATTLQSALPSLSPQCDDQQQQQHTRVPPHRKHLSISEFVPPAAAGASSSPLPTLLFGAAAAPRFTGDLSPTSTATTAQPALASRPPPWPGAFPQSASRDLAAAVVDAAFGVAAGPPARRRFSGSVLPPGGAGAFRPDAATPADGDGGGAAEDDSGGGGEIPRSPAVGVTATFSAVAAAGRRRSSDSYFAELIDSTGNKILSNLGA
ncbi:hypothetical protein HK405_008617 [Cladochytrium tenue]|nr:hypothetical protein HK405_008617 [Cladochytrium tenue]